MDFSVIQKLGDEEKYKSQTDEYQVALAPTTVGRSAPRARRSSRTRS